jgi:hypothetical protein
MSAWFVKAGSGYFIMYFPLPRIQIANYKVTIILTRLMYNLFEGSAFGIIVIPSLHFSPFWRIRQAVAKSCPSVIMGFCDS